MTQTRNLTYGAMTLGITAVLIFLNQISGQVLVFLMALPLSVYGNLFSLKDTFTVYVTSIIIAFFIGSLPVSLLMVGYGGMALAMLCAQKKNYARWQQYACMSLVGLPLYGVMLHFFGAFFGLEFNVLLEYVPYYAAIGVVLLTLFMEVYIIHTSNLLVMRLLSPRRK